MGHSLKSRGGGWYETNCFEALLALARVYGWLPKGTKPPADYKGDWRGNYHSNERQTVDSKDALNLAIALEEALDADPNGIINVADGGNVPLYLLWGESGGRWKLREFSEFCKGGAFRIR